jgi:hypothetical protein
MYSIGTNNLFCALNFGVVMKHTIHFKKGASPPGNAQGETLCRATRAVHPSVKLQRHLGMI